MTLPRLTSTRPTRQQLEWQVEAYTLADSLPFTYSDINFDLCEDDELKADLRVYVQFWFRGLLAGSWSGTIAEFRAFCQGVTRG